MSRINEPFASRHEFTEIYGRLTNCELVNRISVWEVFSADRAISGDYVAEFEASNDSFLIKLSGDLSVDDDDFTLIGGLRLAEVVSYCVNLCEKTPINAHLWCRKKAAV